MAKPSFWVTVNSRTHNMWYPSKRRFGAQSPALKCAKELSPVEGPRGEDLGVVVSVWKCAENGRRSCEIVWSDNKRGLGRATRIRLKSLKRRR
jgi:hypothetical protein